MTTAPGRRGSAGTKPGRPAAARPGYAMWVAAARTIPTAAALVALVSMVLGAWGIVPSAPALAGTVLGLLVLLLFLGLRPLFAPHASPRGRLVGAAVGAVWLVACYAPFHLCLFPGRPLIGPTSVAATGTGLPLAIPAAGHAMLHLAVEGKLPPSPTGGASPPVRFRLTFTEESGGTQTVDGVFDDAIRMRRLGRRGRATVHETHTADLRVLENPQRGNLVLTEVALDPPTTAPLTVSVFVYPLPGTVVLGLLGATLLLGVLVFDRRGPAPETDGALTLATAAVEGTAVVLWTANAVHPDLRTLIGSVIFGGTLGIASGALLWWAGKRLVGRPAR